MVSAFMTYEVKREPVDDDLRKAWNIRPDTEEIYCLVQHTTFQGRNVSYKVVAVFNLDAEAGVFDAWLTALKPKTPHPMDS